MWKSAALRLIPFIEIAIAFLFIVNPFFRWFEGIERRTVSSQRRDFPHVFDISMLDDFKFATLRKIRNYLVGVNCSLIYMAGAAVKKFTAVCKPFSNIVRERPWNRKRCALNAADSTTIYREHFKVSYALRQSIAPVFRTNDLGSADILPNDGRMIAMAVIML